MNERSDYEDRHQHVALAIQKARKNGLPVEIAIKSALIDWDRKKRTERKRLRRTKRLDDLLSEPAAVPDQMEAMMSKTEVNFLLDFLTPQQCLVIASTFLEQRTRREVAAMLEISLQAVTDTKRRAIEVMRKAPRSR